MDQVAVVPFGSPWSRRNVPPCCSARTARLPDPAERLFEHVKHSPFQHRPVALHGTRVAGREFDGDVPGASLGTSNSGFDDVIEPTSGGRVVGRSVASNRFEVTDQRSKLGGLGAKIVKRAAWSSGSVSFPVARTSMLVRRLVSGVRSSWAASSIRRRSCSRDSVSDASIVFKLCASVASSVPPVR